MTVSYRTALIDGSGFAKAAYSTAHKTLAHRFLLRVFKLWEEEPGVDIVVAWDPADNVSRRVARFPAYKEKRRRLSTYLYDENYQRELTELFRILTALGVSQAWADGWEADDVLGTLSRTSEPPVLVLTRDADLLQLAAVPGVDVLMKRGKKEKLYTPGRFEEERGFSPAFFGDWKALAGDAGDGVPGVPGIGEKAATEIVRALPWAVRSILNREEPLLPEDILENTPLSKRAANLLRKAAANPEHLRLMRWLVELHDVEPTFARGRRDFDVARELMREAELRRLSARLRKFL